MPSMLLGTQSDGAIVLGRPEEADSSLRLAKQLGCRHIRFVIYSYILERRGWQLYDDAIAAIRRHGMYPQVAITGCPRWDPEGGPVTHVDPDPERFAAMVSDVVGRYRGSVVRYSMWNEPNHPAFLKLSRGDVATHYGELYAAGWRAAKRAYPSARVLYGELASSKHLLDFVRTSVIGRRFKAHGFAWHPYQYRTAPEYQDPDRIAFGHIPQVNMVLAGLAAEGRLRTPGGKPLGQFLTEFGYFREGWNESKSILESVRADWVPRAWRFAERHGCTQLIYYHLIEGAPGTSWNTGIVTREGEPLPTYEALRAVAR